MSDDIGARVTNFARQIVDVHLPVLVGLMAEGGQQPMEQAERASRVVSLLRGAQVKESLSKDGRPVAVEVQGTGKYRQLVINGKMLARVDDSALASAVAGPLARLLDVSPVTTSLVLQMADIREMRGLAGTLGKQVDGEVISLTRVEELVRWRLETFEERLYRLVDGLGGWLEAPVLDRDSFVERIGECETRWPEWRKLKDEPYISTWLDAVDAELGRTDWAESTAGLGEMIWESVAISPGSALRQAARNLRSLTSGGDRQKLLEVLAEVVGSEDDPIPGTLDEWSSFQELRDAWTTLWGEEDDALGARRRAFPVPEISVYEPPGPAMGFSAPENLPWDMPLLCWTVREREALRDLLGGNEESLARARSQIRVGRLSNNSRSDGQPLVNKARETRWIIQVPSRDPEMPEGFSEAVDRAYTALRASYEAAFANLDKKQQKKAIKLANGAYAGYLKSTKPVWRRRLSGIQYSPLPDIFSHFLTGLADALEWPVFVDVFEGSVDLSTVSNRPRFTVMAVWFGDSEFAPVWLPIETLGEALGQAPIRIRNVAVSPESDRVQWIGDHQIDIAELQELRTDTLLRCVNEGTLLMTVHEL